MALENTNWEMTYTGTDTKSAVKFGANEAPSGSLGGYGTVTTSGFVVDMMWSEDGNGNFMFQTKGPTDPNVNELPTTSGSYRSDTAIGMGSNFDAKFNDKSVWGNWDITMKKQSS